MQFFLKTKRDPVTTILVVIALFIVLFVGFELFRGLHRYHVAYPMLAPEKQTPAGIRTAATSTDSLGLTGWGPPQITIQIEGDDKILAATRTDESGKWAAILPFEKHGRNFQSINLTYQAIDKKIEDLGHISVFAPMRSLEDAYIWWDGPTIRLLQAPQAGEESDLFLARAGLLEDQNIVFAGRGVADRLIQVYADNELVGEAPVTSDGYWTLFSLLKADRKSSALRFDELEGSSGVIERRSYHLDWPDGKDIQSNDMAVLRASKDGWGLGVLRENGKKDVVYVLKPSAGQSLSPDDEIAGQVIPLPVPSQTKDTFR